MQEVGIGIIKLFDPKHNRGVIAPYEALTKQGIPSDVYFEATGNEALQLREGQLVQFVVADTDPDIGMVATGIKVLREQA
jgi:hypothetical protein